jgi:hypothetical protein
MEDCAILGAILYESNGRFKSFIKSKHYLKDKKIIVTGRGNNGMLSKFPMKFAMIAFKIRFNRFFSYF